MKPFVKTFVVSAVSLAFEAASSIFPSIQSLMARYSSFPISGRIACVELLHQVPHRGHGDDVADVQHLAYQPVR
jgi:hypothetical protein